jgi:tRNA uridine 5-carbamoylmethylation protein Kti12
MKSYFHIFRGIPGTGKSTRARALQQILDQAAECFHFEADMYFMRDGEYMFNAAELRYAHEWCQKMTLNKLSLNHPVIVSNTFTTWKEIKPYVEMARKLQVEVLITSCETEYGSVHNVPVDKLDEMRRRYLSQSSLALTITQDYNEASVEIDPDRNILIKWNNSQQTTTSRTM